MEEKWQAQCVRHHCWLLWSLPLRSQVFSPRAGSAPVTSAVASSWGFPRTFAQSALWCSAYQEVSPGHDHLSWWKCPLRVQETTETIAKGCRLSDSGQLVHCFLSHFKLYGRDVRFQDWYFCSGFLSFLFIFSGLQQYVLAASGFDSDVCVLWRIAWHPCYSLDSLHIL